MTAARINFLVGPILPRVWLARESSAKDGKGAAVGDPGRRPQESEGRQLQLPAHQLDLLPKTILWVTWSGLPGCRDSPLSWELHRHPPKSSKGPPQGVEWAGGTFSADSRPGILEGDLKGHQWSLDRSRRDGRTRTGCRRCSGRNRNKTQRLCLLAHPGPSEESDPARPGLAAPLPASTAPAWLSRLLLRPCHPCQPGATLGPPFQLPQSHVNTSIKATTHALVRTWVAAPPEVASPSQQTPSPPPHPGNCPRAAAATASSLQPLELGFSDGNLSLIFQGGALRPGHLSAGWGRADQDIWPWLPLWRTTEPSNTLASRSEEEGREDKWFWRTSWRRRGRDLHSQQRRKLSRTLWEAWWASLCHDGPRDAYIAVFEANVATHLKWGPSGM
ncbi:uncharacterized protein AAG666_025401 [Megaptera novaeangliae]